jgi:hypothetical protein
MTKAPSAGYSGKPLSAKLGFKNGLRVRVLNAPDNYADLVQPVPAGVEFASRLSPGVAMVHLFTTESAELSRTLARLREQLNPDAAVWVSWPKKASKVPTDITEDVIRSIALPLGFVDIKVCAVSEIWSGLKLVVRKSLRP